MVARFQGHIASQNMLPKGSKTLVATSGGVDSVVLCHLFLRAGLPFSIAHCNFQLRGEESDADETFVKAMAQDLRVECFSNRFDTEQFATKNKLSIQEAARILRYDWLEQTRQLADCQLIATAHHLDDSIETLLYNFSKGCGLRGLHGILPRNGHVVRPMLFATKQEMLVFAKQEGIAYREDASNRTDKYARNLLRHHAVPVFEKINPSFQRTARENIERLREAEQLMDFALRQIMADVLEIGPTEWRIDLRKLHSYPAPATVLFELLRPHGFNNDQVQEMLQSADNQPGSWFYSPTRRLLVDRFFLILSLGENSEGVVEFNGIADGETVLPNGQIHWERLEAAPAVFPKDANIAHFDAVALKQPMRLRHWQPGDWFCPLGMGGQRQKLQDFFSNNKLTRLEKEEVWLLECGGDIVWVVGLRQDDRFKVTDPTKPAIRAEFLRG